MPYYGDNIMRAGLILMMGLPLAACAADGGSARAPLRETRGDTTIVTWSGPGAWGDSVSLTEELRIGELEGSDDYTFGAISGVESDGTLTYVVDRIAKNIRVFDEQGRLVRTIGRDGGGPGELRNPSGIGLLPDGRIAVRDYGNRRYNVYSPSGDALASWPIPGGYSTSASFIIDTAGRLYNPMSVAKPGEDWKSGFEVFDSSGAVLDTITPPTRGLKSSTLIAERTTGGATSRAVYGIPFTPQEVWALSPRGYFVGGYTGAYAVESLFPDGKVLRVVRTLDPVAVGDDERAAAEANTLRGLRDTDPDYKWNGPPVPSTKPFFGTIIVDDDGRFWVRTPQPSHEVPVPEDELEGAPGGAPRTRWAEPSVYDVFAAEGEYLGAVPLPDRFEPYVMRGDRIWGVIRDELDVPFVARYRIVHN
ncbi:MAG TPA: 6-bladed beta-propeller [Longimicrobiales bacterium]